MAQSKRLRDMQPRPFDDFFEDLRPKPIMTDPAFREWLLQLGFQSPQPAQAALDDDQLKSRMNQVLSQPLGGPPLRDGCVPGDRVVLAVSAAVPQIGTILQATIEHLLADRTEPVVCQILVTPAVACHLPPSAMPEIEIVIHDAADENNLAMLTVGAGDQALYVHRLLFDADCVIPIHLAHDGQSEDQVDPLFPTFSGLHNRESNAELSAKQRRSDALQVGEYLGNFWGVEVAVGVGLQVIDVVAGERVACSAAIRKVQKKYWRLNVPKLADCIVATMESTSAETAWADVIRALEVCDQFADLHAPLVLWTELDNAPPRSIRAALLKSFRSHLDQSQVPASATRLETILDNHPIFLRSNLPAGLVEDLGLGAIETTEQLERLVSKHSQRVLLRDAHKIQVTESNQPTAKHDLGR